MFRKFRKDESGATALEFAIISGPFILLLLITLDIGFKSFQQSHLDAMAFDFAMKLAREDDVGLTKQRVLETMVCPQTPITLSCENIQFGAKSFDSHDRIENEVDGTFYTSWDTGCAGATVVIEMVYPVSHLITSFAVADIIEVEGEDFYRARGLIRREALIIGSQDPDETGGASC